MALNKVRNNLGRYGRVRNDRVINNRVTSYPV